MSLAVRIRGFACAFCISVAGVASGSDGSNRSAPPTIWECRYVAQPQPVLSCRRSRLDARPHEPSAAPLWDPHAPPSDSPVVIPLHTPPADPRDDSLVALAKSVMCGATGSCYVTFSPPSP